MKHLIGRSCLLEIDHNGKTLYFHAQKVTDVTDHHISFLDRFGKYYTFNLIEVIEVNQVS